LAAITPSNSVAADHPTFVKTLEVDGYGRVTGVVTANVFIELGANTTGNYVANVIPSTGVTISNSGGEGSQPTISIGQDVATTANVGFHTVTANVTGNVTGNLTGNVVGNANTATALATSRTIELTGDVTGSASFNGTANASITATIAANSVALGSDTTGDYTATVVGGTGVTISSNTGEGSSPTIAIGQSVATSAAPTFTGLTINGGNIVFEGATADDFETIIAVTDPTSDRVIVFPDLTGTVVTTGDTGSITSLMIADGAIVNADINVSAAIDKTKISGTAITAGDTGTVTSAMIADATIVNGDISTSAAIAHSKLANATAGQLLLGTTTTGVVTATTVSGDVTIDGAGVTAIASGVIVDADVNASAAIADTKLATISTADKVSLSALNIDGGTDIGAALADADLIIVDDGGAGTNRKAAVTRVTDYVFGKVSGDITIASGGSATIAANSVALGTDTTGDYTATVVPGTGVTITSNTGEGSSPTIAIGQAVSNTSNVTFATVTTTGDLTVGANLILTGNINTYTQNSLSIDDPFIYLNNNSNISNPDLGIAGNYNDGTYKHAGLFRDATDGKWKFFANYAPEPTSPIDTANVSYAAAPLVVSTLDTTATTGTAPITVMSTTLVANLNADLLDGESIAYFAPINSPTFTGTVTLPTGTVTSGMILDGTIANGDIATNAAIAHAKLASTTAAYVLMGNTTGVITGTAISGDVTVTNAGVAAISSGVIVDADISGSAAIALSKLATGTAGNILVYNATGVLTSVAESGDISVSDAGVTAIASGVIVNADVNASAAIDFSKLAALTSGNILVGSASNVVTSVAVSGDVTIAANGNVQIASGAIVNADISASAAIELSKLATSTAGNIIVYNASGVPTAVAESGDISIDSSGVTAIATGVIVNADVSATAAIDLGKLADVSTSAQTASYTLVLADKNKIVEMNVGSGNTLTVPTNANVAYPVGSQIMVLQTGAGQTTIAGQTVGVTVNGTPGLKLRTQWAMATLVKRATDTWVVVGDLSA
jgi:hypothetical protein